MNIDNGNITIDTLPELIANLEADYKSIYGNDIAISQDTPDGQRIGIIAKINADLQEAVLSTYNNNDPDLSQGTALDAHCKLSGITRQVATRSSWDINLTIIQDVTLEANYKVRDEAGNVWFLENEKPLTVGTHSVTFLSETWGAVKGLSSYTFEQVTINKDVTTVAATVNSTIGIDEESDEDLRIRRNNSLQKPSLTTLGSIYSNLANISGVSDLVLYENNTGVTDAKGLDGHSIWVVIRGGDNTKIAEVIT